MEKDHLSKIFKQKKDTDKQIETISNLHELVDRTTLPEVEKVHKEVELQVQEIDGFRTTVTELFVQHFFKQDFKSRESAKRQIEKIILENNLEVDLIQLLDNKNLSLSEKVTKFMEAKELASRSKKNEK